MPYSQIMDLPESIIKALPMPALRIFMAAFNLSYKENRDEEISMKIAWSAVKKAGFKKGNDGSWAKS